MSGVPFRKISAAERRYLDLRPDELAALAAGLRRIVGSRVAQFNRFPERER